MIFGFSYVTAKFRITLTLPSEKHDQALGDSESLDFKLVGHELATRVTALFDDLPGNRISVVEKLEKLP